MELSEHQLRAVEPARVPTGAVIELLLRDGTAVYVVPVRSGWVVESTLLPESLRMIGGSSQPMVFVTQANHGEPVRFSVGHEHNQLSPVTTQSPLIAMNLIDIRDAVRQRVRVSA